ncbi:hypothetical protein AWM70_04775 [Paenibacillus yonginensis]|uniref:Uncharacterized protein n=1 Tax=Paenibacillus yonginensis TaxID=1462996 RepID=A0A1B1MXR5_9BACL|nr:hypothetical protein [Paenibacillus yonginensis]ANS73968.1 hypothetical protein AWM70_04775 [Paenibacillus yonginensis]
MKKRPKGKGSKMGANHVQQIPQAGCFKEVAKSSQKQLNERIYWGPSEDGEDVEYIETLSGKVSNRKPSFLRERFAVI